MDVSTHHSTVPGISFTSCYITRTTTLNLLITNNSCFNKSHYETHISFYIAGSYFKNFIFIEYHQVFFMNVTQVDSSLYAWFINLENYKSLLVSC
jgi:hypothetical protein